MLDFEQCTGIYRLGVILQALNLSDIYPEHASPEEAAILWESLASLQHLSTLQISTDREDDIYFPDCANFFDRVSLLTNIRWADSHSSSQYTQILHMCIVRRLMSLCVLDCCRHVVGCLLGGKTSGMHETTDNLLLLLGFIALLKATLHW